jgi:hypothetical protein
MLAGCGDGGVKMAPVEGTVTYNGQAVTGGGVVFAPLESAHGSGQPGKPAEAAVDSDGGFALSTYGTEDGAVIGKHTVSYSPPGPQIPEEGLKPGQMPPRSPYDGLVPKNPEVEVRPGSNQIDIELVKQ